MNAGIVIPVYKSALRASEQISLQRCRQIIGRYPIVIVAPKTLNVKAYRDILGSIDLITFPDEYFQSLRGYSRLLCSRDFYARFINWKYLLLYQPDCYIFKDELEFWCNQDYDFVGPPWLSFDWLSQSNRRFARVPFLGSVLNKVGNGGFSLRNVGRFYDLADKIGWLERISGINEDLVWSNVPRWLFQRFNIPDVDTALKFGFDAEPQRCYELTNRHLPFGCHGWEKNDMEFWRQFISAEEIRILARQK